jgi:hypothetical protein
MSSPNTTVGGPDTTPGTGAAKPPPVAAAVDARDLAAGSRSPIGRG